VCWRDFYHHHLARNPHVLRTASVPELRRIRWDDERGDLAAWAAGETGYPLVDAGMRQLAEDAWVHNRGRMVVASFLAKDLLVDWRRGEAWFWDTLVDADLASNSANWQWVAGCGADAAPFFRIFNPVLQGEKFDPGGAYVRRFVPELKDVPDRYVHRPWEAPQPPAHYPAPILDLAEGRSRALQAFKALKGT
jgi:deoxyribodipyrimidine photo-lyase